MKLKVLYFAALRERAGCAEESVECEHDSLTALYQQLRVAHGLGFEQSQLRVAVDGEFVDWSRRPSEGEEIAFIPPVSGG